MRDPSSNARHPSLGANVSPYQGSPREPPGHGEPRECGARPFPAPRGSCSFLSQPSKLPPALGSPPWVPASPGTPREAALGLGGASNWNAINGIKRSQQRRPGSERSRAPCLARAPGVPCPCTASSIPSPLPGTPAELPGNLPRGFPPLSHPCHLRGGRILPEERLCREQRGGEAMPFLLQELLGSLGTSQSSHAASPASVPPWRAGPAGDGVGHARPRAVPVLLLAVPSLLPAPCSGHFAPHTELLPSPERAGT